MQMPALHKASLTPKSRANPSLAQAALDLTNRQVLTWKRCLSIHSVAFHWHRALERMTQCMYTLSPHFLCNRLFHMTFMPCCLMCRMAAYCTAAARIANPASSLGVM